MKFLLRRLAVLALATLLLTNLHADTELPLTSAEHNRSVEQTLLTFPEWSLVFSPDEYARFTANQAPSHFPFYGHIGQFWQSYSAVTRETIKRKLDLNPGYHLMIMVIGVSTTVEYALRSAYETLIGRLSGALGGQPTAEDRYAAKAAKEYVDFIRVSPWYEFDFVARLRGLWADTDLWGPSPLRKWERKFALTTEYAIKMIYGQVIKLGTKNVYDEPLLVTAAVTSSAPKSNADLPELKILNTLPDDRVLLTVPRYEAFMRYADALAAAGLNFEEIAGNRSFILVSLLAKTDWQPPPDLSTLFVQPILTRSPERRIALIVPVARLAEQLRQWQKSGIRVEHIFDY